MFDPGSHRDTLAAALREIDALIGAGDATSVVPLDTKTLHSILRRHPRAGSGLYSRAELIAGYRAFESTEHFVAGSARFVAHVQLPPVRTQSGVTPITVLTKPYPCPGQCVFCPNDVRMPKSYLTDEPGCQRAEMNGFDPYLQTYQRLAALRAIGHPTDKAELIVLGGTFSFYPKAYQRFFVKRCFDALNDFGAGRDGCERARQQALWLDGWNDKVDGRAIGAGYNKAVTRLLVRDGGSELLRPFEHASQAELQAAHAENEDAQVRCVGLVLETRPDHIDEAEVVHLRSLGCTKVQIGYQSLDDTILALNKRGHDVAATRRAMRLLRQGGFKVLAHYMPNLLGATPDSDVRDFARIFDDADFRPDELKVYPCSLIESAELMAHYEAGRYVPYSHEQLLAVFESVLSGTPRYCRLARVVRDISSGVIVAGNRMSNFREVGEASLRRKGVALCDIRAREIRDGRFDREDAALRTTRYATGIGEELFIEMVTPEDRLLGFCRLALPSQPGFIAETQRSALLREVHVYGASVELGVRDATRAQHRGLGRRLVLEAAAQAYAAGFTDLAVISAVGTRGYYRKLGFTDGALYHHLALPVAENTAASS